MAGRILLIGGPTDALLRKVGARALAAVGRPRAKVAALYAPIAGHPDGLSFMQRSVADMFPDADVHRVVLPGEEAGANADDARRALEAADVVFVSGGDPVLGANLVRESGAHAWLHAAHERGAAVVGASAGSIVLGEWWASWPEDESDGAHDEHQGAKLVECAGVARGLVLDAHDEADDWCELRAVARLAKKHGDHLRFVGIPTAGAIAVDVDGKIESIGRPPFFLP